MVVLLLLRLLFGPTLSDFAAQAGFTDEAPEGTKRRPKVAPRGSLLDLTA